MKLYIPSNLFIFLTALSFLVSCKKQDDFLNVKRNLSDVTPKTLADFQAVLDYPTTMNQNFPSLAFLGTDNIYLSDANVGAALPIQRAAYLWLTDLYQGLTGYASDWAQPYSTIESSNIVLDGISNISTSSSNLNQYNNVKGSALFYRSFMFYVLAQTYAKPYDSSSAISDLGIVLRMTSDVNALSTRATVKQTYDQIIEDLKTAISLLPVTPTYLTRPSQPAASALLAKVYLSMGDFKDALSAANASLNLYSTLLDFNSTVVLPNSAYPFPSFPKNPEIVFWGVCTGGGINYLAAGPTVANVDTNLYKSYDSTDLRKTLFFSTKVPGSIFFRGTYAGAFQAFSGIGTNEILLIRAECNARLRNTTQAQDDLSFLLRNRYKTGTYVPVNFTDPNQLLLKILLERRKELPFTGQLRWEDLRRLNRESRFAIILKRVSNGLTYTLTPNDLKYTLSIPPDETNIDQIQQNPR